MLDLLVMRILLADPIRVLCPQFEPNPICQVGMELSVRMETVTRLNHAFGIAAFHHLSLEDLH